MRAESAFACAVELVFADRAVTLREQEYIEGLARQLELDPTRAKAIVETLEWMVAASPEAADDPMPLEQNSTHAKPQIGEGQIQQSAIRNAVRLAVEGRKY